MHACTLAGRARAAESREAAGAGVGEAEPSRVEASRGPRAISAHAPPTDESVCTLLARSLAKLTRASENAGESRSADQGYLRYVIHWRGDRGINRAS